MQLREHGKVLARLHPFVAIQVALVPARGERREQAIALVRRQFAEPRAYGVEQIAAASGAFMSNDVRYA